MAKVWRYTIQLPPMGTPRPRTRRLDDGRTITYYDQSYSDYLDAIQEEYRVRRESRNHVLCTSAEKPKAIKKADKDDSTRYR